MIEISFLPHHVMRSRMKAFPVSNDFAHRFYAGKFGKAGYETCNKRCEDCSIFKAQARETDKAFVVFTKPGVRTPLPSLKDDPSFTYDAGKIRPLTSPKPTR